MKIKVGFTIILDDDDRDDALEAFQAHDWPGLRDAIRAETSEAITYYMECKGLNIKIEKEYG